MALMRANDRLRILAWYDHAGLVAAHRPAVDFVGTIIRVHDVAGGVILSVKVTGSKGPSPSGPATWSPPRNPRFVMATIVWSLLKRSRQDDARSLPALRPRPEHRSGTARRWAEPRGVILIANLCSEPHAGSSDGLVAFSSARLEGAASEVLVRTGHFCLRHPDVIREVGRILRPWSMDHAGLNNPNPQR